MIIEHCSSLRIEHREEPKKVLLGFWIGGAYNILELKETEAIELYLELEDIIERIWAEK